MAGEARHRWVLRICAVLSASWMFLTGTLVLCGYAIKHSGTVNSADRRITSFVVNHRTATLNGVMRVVTWTGSWIAVLVVAVAVGALSWRRCLPILALGAVLASWVGELLAVTLAKPLVERHRPPEAAWAVVAHGWAFPSGHAANAVVVFSTAAALMARLSTSTIIRLLCWISAILLVALVGFSRIELGVHWTTDVLAGAAWATAWTAAVVAVMQGSATASWPNDRPGSGARVPGCRRILRRLRRSQGLDPLGKLALRNTAWLAGRSCRSDRLSSLR